VLAHRRLADAQPAGRLGEAVRVRDGEERAEQNGIEHGTSFGNVMAVIGAIEVVNKPAVNIVERVHT
jgi:hypothetical protein